MIKYFFSVILMIVFLNNSFAQEFLPANQNTLDSLKEVYKGKVLFVNFWATWCKPCTEEFPDILKLNSEYKDKDFKLIFVSLDFGKDLETQTQKYLSKMNVEFTTYYNAFKNDEDLINYMDKKWEGSIPGTFIFDKSGILRKTFIGKTDFSDFKKAVDKYIN
ncbi:MAG TPA: TlpA disulfide reductase family protein [Ignavibacteria bacterium]|nr:TlpA disulfide reductase family protein [Ignavibacteria bacterium]